MVERDITIKNKLGLHARAAAQLVNLAASFKSEVSILKDGQSVNGKSIMGLMMLGASRGTDMPMARSKASQSRLAICSPMTSSIEARVPSISWQVRNSPW